MGYYARQKEIVQAIVNRVKTVSGLEDSSYSWVSPAQPTNIEDPTKVDVRRVILGKRSSSQSAQWPLVWVVPVSDPMEDMNFNAVLHNLSISIFVTDKATNLESLFLNVWEWLGGIYDVLMANRENPDVWDDIKITNIMHDVETERDENSFYQVGQIDMNIEYHARPECES